MVVDQKAKSRQYDLSHLSLDLSERLRAFCYMAESMQPENMPKVMHWLDEKVRAQRFRATPYDPESYEWFSQTIGDEQVLITPQFHALEDLGLPSPQLGTTSRPPTAPAKISEVADLDRLINDGLDLQDQSRLTPGMRLLLEDYLVASKHMKHGDLHGAISLYRDILSKWPNFVAPRVNLGHCVLYLGDAGQALREFQQAHKLAPSDPDIHIATGRVYEALGNKQAELQQYREAVADDPNHVEAMTNLGLTYREVGDLEQSYHWLGRALERIEREERARNQFGWQHPSKANTLAGMAETCEASGEWRRALECWEKAKVAAPEDSRFDACIRRARRKTRWSWLPWRS